MRQRIVTRKIAALGCRPEFWLVCLLAWLLVSACRSLGTPWARIALTESLRWGIGIGLALTLSATLHRTGTAARVLILLAGALALAGVWDGFRPEHGGVVGPYQDHQLYGSALLVLLPTVVALALTGRDALWRLGAQAVAASVLVCLLLSQTRSAWAGLLAAALVFGWLWLKQSRGERRRKAIPAACAAALLVAAMSVWAVTAPSELRAPLASRTATFSNLSSDQSWQARLTTWRGAVRMATAFPLTGCGLGRYTGMQWNWTHQGALLSPSARPSLSEEAHNFYLQTAVEMGLTGLALYGMALAAFVALGLRRLRRKNSFRPSSRDALVIAALSMVAGQSVDAIASPSWQFAEVSLLFWAALGVGLAAMRRPEPEPVAVHYPLPLRRAGQMALSGATAVLLAAQILPVGLLAPVEAYTPTAGTYAVTSSPALPHSGSADFAYAGDTVYYIFTATDSGTHQTVNLTTDSKTTMLVANQPGTQTYPSFVDAASGRLVFTVPIDANNKIFVISGKYSGSTKAFATLQIYGANRTP